MKSLLYITTFTFLVCFTFSCRDEGSGIGGKWVDSSFTNIYTDTCTVTLSTILLDSVATSGDTIAQIGHYYDDLRGDILCSFYTQYKMGSITFSEDVNYAFDSLTISFYSSGDYLGDTLATPQTIYIHKLSESLDLENDYLYNVSATKYDPHPYVSFSFNPSPGRKDEIKVRLPDEMGKEFFEFMRQGNIVFSSDEYFRSYFPGFAFLADKEQKCLNGFVVNDSSFCINLHYRQIDDASTDKVASFIPNTDYCFNKIVHDRSNTIFANLKSNTSNALPSDSTENMAYMQALSGMYINIEFPHLNELRKQGELVSIENASLQLYPVQDTYGDDTPLPSRLTLYTTSDDYVAEDVLTDSWGSDVQTGNLTIDDLYFQDTYYTFDITSFLQSNFGTYGNNRKKLMLMMPDDKFMTTVDGVFLGDMQHPTSRIQLHVLYKTYNQQ